MIEVISATREPEASFRERTPLGISLSRLQQIGFGQHIFFSNTNPLPICYNERIELSTADTLLFIHDDVWIDDYHIFTLLTEALLSFHVVGVAGNRRREPFQVAWPFPITAGIWDDPVYLSGAVAHGQTPFGTVSFFGETPAECELLDGVLIAVNRQTLIDTGVRFDPQFAFHFYDLDFCRSARKHDLRLGTWPIAITHVSGGSFNSEAWYMTKQFYFDKWKS